MTAAPITPAADAAEVALRLAAFLSPAMPTGGFAYSHGLEWAVAAGEVTDAATLSAWIGDVLAHGSGRTDAILLAHALRDPDDATLPELAEALCGGAERRRETLALGAAFAAAVSAGWGPTLAPAAYPVAFGRACAAHGIPAGAALPAFLHAMAATLATAGMKLIPLGQSEGQRVIAGLAPRARAVAAEAAEAPLEDIGGAGLAGDIAALRHETLTTRLFRT